MSSLNRSGIRRSGDDYQDLFALEIAIDWLEHPDRYQWVRLEAEDFAGSLDDATALRSDGAFVARQIKWTSDTDKHQLSWDWILQKDPNKPKKKSLLEKWSASFFALRQNHECKEAAVYTNRQVEDDFRVLLDEKGWLNTAELTNGVKEKITEQVGSDEKLIEFFAAFQFHADHPDRGVKREALFRRFQRLGGDQQGFNNLLSSIREWAKHKNNPIKLEDVRSAAQWTVLDNIFQGFHIPESYVLPDSDFHRDYRERLLKRKEPLTVLHGAPGVGKSTYLSYLKKEIEGEGLPVVRHHYYLSQDDTTGDRYTWSVVSQSLMSQIQENYGSVLGDIANRNPNPRDIRTWVEQCGAAHKNEGKPFVVIVDGLDHVYRDRGAADSLLGIVDSLLPVPDNVVLILGTRDVDDAHFPRKLLDMVPKTVWIELPFMDGNAVRQWVDFHANQIGVSQDARQRNYRLDSVSDALFRKSNGYPLHLTYTLQALLDTGQAVSETNISALPACPDNDIKRYYDALMRSLDESGRIMLHILCACGFKWPDGALSECLSPNYGTIPDIKKTESKVHHLLRLDRMGLSVYHVSLEEYVCSLPDHSAVVKQAYPLVITWLESAAPELWRWAYLWIIHYKNGEPDYLTNGPTEEWLADAFLKGYPLYQIDDILERAGWAALDKSDLVRTLQLGLMGDYARSAKDYQTHGLERLLFCQLREAWSDGSLKARLLSEPYVLSDGELALSAERFSQDDQIENVRVFKDYFESEFFSQKRADRYGHDIDSWNDVYYLDIIASLKPEDASKLLDWVRKYDEGRNDYTRHLQRLVSLNASTALQNVAKSELEPREAKIAARCLHHLVGRQSIQLSSWKLCHEVRKTLLTQIRFYIEGAKSTTPYFSMPDTEIFNRSHREFYGPQPELTSFYHDVFFSCLLLHLYADGAYEDIWLKRLDVHDWIIEACKYLAEAAKKAAELLRSGAIPSADWLYAQFESIDVPRDIHHSQEGTYCRYFQWALIDISYDLLSFTESPPLQKQRMEEVIESKHFEKELWLDNLINLRAEGFLSSSALEWFCEQEEIQLLQTIKQFNERYEDYMRLAQVCVLHGQSAMSEKYAMLAVQDALAVNFHKDSFLFGLSDIVLDCAKAGIGETESWLVTLAPLVDQITECTDGDETDHVQLDFGEAVLHIQPERFPAFYRRYLDNHEWYRSDNLLSRFKAVVDSKDSLNSAILATYIKKEDRSYSSDDNDNVREEEPVDFAAYPPERLAEFLEDLDSKNRIFEGDVFQGWFEHWSVETEQKPKILESMRSVVESDSSLPFRTGVFYNLMLQLSLDVSGKDAAYAVIPHAHQESYGWSIHGTRTEAEARFQLIVRHWPEKWFDFVKDTALPRKAYSRDGYPPSIGLSRLVQYLLIIGKADVVVQIGNMLVDFALERSKNMAFPPSPWVEAAENQYGFIPLLFDRLDWPDLKAREEACQQIVILLQDDQYQDKVKDYFWLWLSTRVLESQCITAIVLFYKCRLENQDIFRDEELERLIGSIPAPSALSWLLLSELKGKPLDREPEYANLHSGDVPRDYKLPDYFIDYKRVLLPPLYDMRVDAMEQRGVFGLRRQWAFEVTCLYDRENVEARYPYAHYFVDRGTQKRVSVFDLPQSEIFQSAYLRALAWAFHNWRIKKARMLYNSMAFCPVEFCSWQVRPSEKPGFWPQIESVSENIDQTPEQVFQSLEGLLSIDRDEEHAIGYASGPISTCFDEHSDVDYLYELEVYGLFQKNLERDGEIDAEDIVRQLRQIEDIHTNRVTANLEGALPVVDVNEKSVISAGASFAPSVFSLRADPIARWQNKQMYRGIRVAAPYLAQGQPILTAKDNRLRSEYRDTVLSETSYWAFDQLDYWLQSFPPPLGVCTVVFKEDIRRFCEVQNASFCWLVQLTFHYKEGRSDNFLEKKFYKFYEVSNIILPD